MSKTVIKNAQLIVNSVDLSSQVESVTIERKFDEVEVTAMGDAAHSMIAGLESNKLTVNLFDSYATSGVHQTLSALLGSTAAVTVKPTANATSSTNPAWSFTVLVSAVNPFDGKVGDALKKSVTWPINTTITEATS